MTCKKCDTCSFRGSVAGSTHSSCEEPLIKGMAMDILKVNMLSQNPNNTLSRFNLSSSNSEYTVGFPMDFDPIWLSGHCLQHSDNDIVDTYILYNRVHKGIVFKDEQIAEIRKDAFEKGLVNRLHQ